MGIERDRRAFPLAAAISTLRAGRLVWRAHVLRRMVERGIGRSEVFGAIIAGEVIEEYPDDSPYPSALLLGFVEGRPLHVVLAFDEAAPDMYIITAYEPSPDKFEPDWKARRTP